MLLKHDRYEYLMSIIPYMLYSYFEEEPWCKKLMKDSENPDLFNELFIDNKWKTYS